MFLITLKQVAILLFYILLGFSLCKAKIIGKEGSKILSKLLVYVFSPAYSLCNLSSSISIEKIVEYAVSIACGIVVVLLAILFGIIVSRLFSKDKLERNIYKYVLAFGNLGYFGYPLISAVFGADVLATFMLFCVPINIGISTYGYFVLTQTEDKTDECVDNVAKKRDLIKRIFSVPMIFTVIGIILGLLPINMPTLFYDVLTPAGNCMSVSAMILSGIVLASCTVKELFCSVKSYFAGGVRLIICPLIFGGLAFILYRFVGLSADIFICITACSCLPAGMNAIVYPESVGLSGKSGAKVCFISYILALATIPLWFYLLEILVNI